MRKWWSCNNNNNNLHFLARNSGHVEFLNSSHFIRSRPNIQGKFVPCLVHIWMITMTYDNTLHLFLCLLNLKNVKISDQGPAIAGTAGLVFVTKFGWKTRQVENTASGQFRVKSNIIHTLTNLLHTVQPRLVPSQAQQTLKSLIVFDLNLTAVLPAAAYSLVWCLPSW